jgi:hypothetical protein
MPHNSHIVGSLITAALPFILSFLSVIEGTIAPIRMGRHVAHPRPHGDSQDLIRVE